VPLWAVRVGAEDLRFLGLFTSSADFLAGPRSVLNPNHPLLYGIPTRLLASLVPVSPVAFTLTSNETPDTFEVRFWFHVLAFVVSGRTGFT